MARLSLSVNLARACALAVVTAALASAMDSQSQDLNRPQPLRPLSNPSAPILPSLPIITLDGPAKTVETTSFEKLSLSAEAGNPIDQGELGHLYAIGDGVPQDFGAALKWLRASAEHNYPDAQFYIGQIYFNGDGVDQDFGEALKWFVKAAQQGNRDVQYLVSIMYAEGMGTTPDPIEASKWLRLSAVQGNIGAQRELGRLTPDGALQASETSNKASDTPVIQRPSTNLDARIKSTLKQVFKGTANQ